MTVVATLSIKTDRQCSTSHRLCHCDTLRLAHQREVQQRTRPHRPSREACEASVLQHRGRLLAVARRMLRCEEDAADAVQDALLSAWASIHQFRKNSQLYTWLHRILVNACLMKLRSQKRRFVASLDALLPAFNESGKHAHPVTPWRDTATQRIEQKETQAIVRKCIDQLPDDYRAILILRDIEELDTDETAALLNISRAAVKTRLHRARQALRTLLAPILLEAE